MQKQTAEIRKKHLEHLIGAMNAYDGYRVIETVTANSHARYFCFFDNGDLAQFTVDPTQPPVDRLLLCRYVKPSEKDFGDLFRTTMLWQSIAMFLNTGGTFAEIATLLTQIGATCGSTRLTIPGFYYSNSVHNAERVYEHLFLPESPDDKHGIIWVDGSHMATIKLERLVLANEKKEERHATETNAKLDVQRRKRVKAKTRDVCTST